jgi:KDO2-lipid IV(A) lauroyltransferase
VKIIFWVLFIWLYALSLLPFWILHFFSTLIYFLVYHVWKYRVTVVRENLKNSFPEKSIPELRAIERKFYVNLCDLVIETIKTFSISRTEIKKRCVCTTPELLAQLYQERKNLTGISSHLGNWEWLSLSLSFEFQHKAYGIYKPLANAALDEMLIRSRGRFGFELVPMKRLREIFKKMGESPIVIGLLSDQAPHSYAKAFEVLFLHQKTFVFPGPGIISVERNFTPVWGWMRRTGRSRFEWGVEVIEVAAAAEKIDAIDVEQIERIGKLHQLSREDSARALAITQEFNRRLETRIQANPADWLWSHRRWKIRE